MSSIARLEILRRPYVCSCAYGVQNFTRRSQRQVYVRWNSGGEGGEGPGKNQKRAGFFENFLSNLQQGLKRNKEMQESLQGLREERERMQRSYVLQQWREEVEESWRKAREGGRKGWEVVGNLWGKTRKGLSKVYNSL